MKDLIEIRLFSDLSNKIDADTLYLPYIISNSNKEKSLPFCATSKLFDDKIL